MSPEPIAPAPPPLPADAAGATAEAERIIHGDKTHPYHVKHHPEHEAAVAKVARLFSVAAPEPDTPRDDAAGEPGDDDAPGPEPDDVPDDPAPFTLEAPPGPLARHYSPDLLADLAAIAHSVGLGPEDTQAMVNAAGTGGDPPALNFQPWSGTYETARTALRRTLGPFFPEATELAILAARKLGLYDALHVSNQANNPRVLRALAKAGAHIATHNAINDPTHPDYTEYHHPNPVRRRRAAAHVQRWIRFGSRRRA